MKNSTSRWAFCLGFLAGALGVYFFLSQVWFERSYPVLSEAQEKAAVVGESTTSWRKEGAAFINLLHPHHAGASHWSSPCKCAVIKYVWQWKIEKVSSILCLPISDSKAETLPSVPLSFQMMCVFLEIHLIGSELLYLPSGGSTGRLWSELIW